MPTNKARNALVFLAFFIAWIHRACTFLSKNAQLFLKAVIPAGTTARDGGSAASN